MTEAPGGLHRIGGPRTRAALAYMAFFAAAGAFVPYLPLYYRELGFQLGEIGGLLALAALVGLAAAPWWGAFSDRRRGSPLVLLAATAASIGGVGLLVFGAEPFAAVAGAAALGFGTAGMLPIIDARALEAVGADRSSYGPLRAWGSVGYVGAALATGVIVEATGPVAQLGVATLALLATGAIGLTLRPVAGRIVLGPAARPIRDAGRLFGPSGLGLFLLGVFLAWLGMSSVLSFTPLRFEELGAGASMIGLGGALAAGVEVPLMLRYPALAARFSSAQLLIAGAGFLALRSVVAALANTPELLLSASIFGGIGYALFLVAGVTYVASKAPPGLAATAQGVFQGIGSSLSNVTATALGGTIAAFVGIQGLFFVGAALGIAATVTIALAVRPEARQR
jgi:PPP family 3-phenylpropionic acid transporter